MTKLRIYAVSAMTEVFIGLQKYKVKLISEQFKVYFAAIKYAKKNFKIKLSNMKDIIIPNNLEKYVGKKDVWGVRILLKNYIIDYLDNENKFMKLLKYAEDNLDDLYQDDVEDIDISTTKDQYQFNTEKIVDNFTRKNIWIMYKSAQNLFGKKKKD